MTGSLLLSYDDLQLRDVRETFILKRTYESVHRNKGMLLGSRWFLNIESRVLMEGDHARVQLPDMHLASFEKNGDGLWVNTRGGDRSVQLRELQVGASGTISATIETTLLVGGSGLTCAYGAFGISNTIEFGSGVNPMLEQAFKGDRESYEAANLIIDLLSMGTTVYACDNVALAGLREASRGEFIKRGLFVATESSLNKLKLDNRGGVGGTGSGINSHISVISEKALKNIKNKWGQKGIDAFKKAMNKGMVGPEGQSGIKPLKGKPLKGKYTHEIKVKNKEYGDYRIYGYQDDDGTMIFDYFDKGLH